MPLKCANQLPTIRVKLHIPATNWHGHHDQTFTEKQPTEWEAWAQAMRHLLSIFTSENARLMVGYWLDALNVLPPDLRLVLIQGIAQGYGLEIRTVPSEPDTIEVDFVQRYPPLVGVRKTESGLVVPNKGAPNVIAPGDPQFHG